MKKKTFFFAALCCVAIASLTSCKDDECTCSESSTGVSETVDLDGYSSCSALEKALNKESSGYLDWDCK